jgi:hypothetical protein
MRLLHTTTHHLRDFWGDDVPFYAILSHRWEATEVSFQDLMSGNAAGMPAFKKIRDFCRQAKSDGFEYAWVDTCCIDKTSSAELSEAINSMFQWYRNAQVCYAFLSDVPTVDDDLSEFRTSKWFTRGWTLQELLAPQTVIFFDCEWKEIGTKASLIDVVSEVTRIAVNYLTDFRGASVAQKMSWVAGRQTSRDEDIAYSLLGLFSVHMPPLYGEGQNAFQRLQQEIIRTSDDESIFAWRSPYVADYPTNASPHDLDAAATSRKNRSGLLAPSLDYFADSGTIRGPGVFGFFARKREHHRPYSFTNKGIQIELQLRQNVSATKGWFIAPLNCTSFGKLGVAVALIVSRCIEADDRYERIATNLLYPIDFEEEDLENPVDPLSTADDGRKLLIFKERPVRQPPKKYDTQLTFIKTQALLESGFRVRNPRDKGDAQVVWSRDPGAEHTFWFQHKNSGEAAINFSDGTCQIAIYVTNLDSMETSISVCAADLLAILPDFEGHSVSQCDRTLFNLPSNRYVFVARRRCVAGSTRTTIVDISIHLSRETLPRCVSHDQNSSTN